MNDTRRDNQWKMKYLPFNFRNRSEYNSPDLIMTDSPVLANITRYVTNFIILESLQIGVKTKIEINRLKSHRRMFLDYGLCQLSNYSLALSFLKLMGRVKNHTVEGHKRTNAVPRLSRTVRSHLEYAPALHTIMLIVCTR